MSDSPGRLEVSLGKVPARASGSAISTVAVRNLESKRRKGALGSTLASNDIGNLSCSKGVKSAHRLRADSARFHA